MPAKRIIICDKSPTGAYRYVLWADVPAGNQIAYRNPVKTSSYENASPAELQAIRDGLVAEKSGSYNSPSDSVATMRTNLQSFWTAFQTEVTAETPWAEYGSFWNNSAAWNSTPGVPWLTPQQEGEMATFFALTPVSAFATNKFHFVLFNNAGATTQALALKVRMVIVLPGQSGVTGALPTVWTLRRRESPTTAPAGGTVVAGSADSAQVLPSSITIHNAPTTAPAGGTSVTFNEFIPQADEQKLTTLDAPTWMGLLPWGGLTVYKACDIPGTHPIVLRANQSLEIQQSATAGTGNCRILCVFTVG